MIAQRAAEAGIILLRRQPLTPRQLHQLLEELLGVVAAAGAMEGLHEP